MVWNVTPIAARPALTLIEWQVFEVRGAAAGNEATVHFVGYAMERWRVRVSSPVIQFDLERRRGLTVSGQVYELRGSAGTLTCAMELWVMWKVINEVTHARDVTRDFVASPSGNTSAP